MNYEDIEKRALALFVETRPEEWGEGYDMRRVRAIREAMLSLVSQAYEAAAREAEAYKADAPETVKMIAYRSAIAERIRALKESLHFGHSEIERALPLQDELNHSR